MGKWKVGDLVMLQGLMYVVICLLKNGMLGVVRYREVGEGELAEPPVLAAPWVQKTRDTLLPPGYKEIESTLPPVREFDASALGSMLELHGSTLTLLELPSGEWIQTKGIRRVIPNTAGLWVGAGGIMVWYENDDPGALANSLSKEDADFFLGWLRGIVCTTED